MVKHQTNEVLDIVESAEIINDRGRATIRWKTIEVAQAKRKEVAERII